MRREGPWKNPHWFVTSWGWERAASSWGWCRLFGTNWTAVHNVKEILPERCVFNTDTNRIWFVVFVFAQKGRNPGNTVVNWNNKRDIWWMLQVGCRLGEWMDAVIDKKVHYKRCSKIFLQRSGKHYSVFINLQITTCILVTWSRLKIGKHIR